MDVNGVDIWVFLVAFLAAACAPILPVQRFVHILREESYSAIGLLARIKQEKAYGKSLPFFWIAWTVIELGIFTFFTFLGLFTDLPQSFAHTLTFVGVASASVASSVVWFFIWRRKSPEKILPVTAREVRLNITLAALLALAQAAYITLVALPISILNLLTASSFRESCVNIIYTFSMAPMFISMNLQLSPYLVAFASLLISPLESLLEKRKSMHKAVG